MSKITLAEGLAMQERCERARRRKSSDLFERPRECADKESDIRNSILKWCASQWPKWKVISARTDKPSTLAVGCQDLTIFAPGRVLCIELKKPDGKLSTDQRDWCKEMEMLGHDVFVVRSFDQFLIIVGKS